MKTAAAKQKPPSELGGFSLNLGRGERIRTSGLYVPNPEPSLFVAGFNIVHVNKINKLRVSAVTAHKPGAVAPGVASPLTRSSSQDVSDELPAGRKKFQ